MLLFFLSLTASTALNRGMALWPEVEGALVSSLPPGSQSQVTLRVTSNLDNAVSCDVSKKSAFVELDATACSIVAPKLDGIIAKGNKPTHVKVRWYVRPTASRSDFDGAIPFDPPSWVGPIDVAHATPSKGGSGRTEIGIDISKNGSVSACRITKSSGSEKLDQRFCELISSRAAFLPSLDESGMPRIAHGKTAISWWNRP